MADETATTTTAAATSTPTSGAATTAATQPAGATEQGGAPQSSAADETTLLGGSKPEDGKSAEGEQKPDGEGDKKPEGDDGKPITYEAFKLPDGFQLDEAKMTAAQALFAEAKLDQATAQKFVDMYTAETQAAALEPYKVWGEQQRAWQDEIKADTEFGGDKLSTTLATASKAIDRFGGDALRAALNATGAGNHPEVIRTFAKIGQRISEDKFVAGSPVGQDAPKTLGQVLYDKDPLKRE